VTSEVALAFLLLVGAGLLLKTYSRLQSVALGFETSRVLLSELVLPEARYAKRAAQSQAFSGIVTRLSEIPGVENAAYVTTPPLNPRGGIGSRFLIDGRTFEQNSEPGARVRFVLGDYFRAIGLRLVAGRGFAASDADGTELVAVVNRRFAREQLPGGSPLGRRLSFRDWNPDRQVRWMTVVGVVEDVKGVALRQPDSATVYVPFEQRPQDWVRWGTLVVRSKADPMSVLPQVRQAVWAIDPTLPLANVQPAARLLREASAQERFNAFSLAMFSAVALGLALQGLYGILAFMVEQRRREIGVRMALGASSSDLLRLIVGRGLALVTLGLVIGAGFAFASRRVVEGLLFEVAPSDAAIYALTAAALLGAALLACALPARRAARVDPITVLRAD
jgi:putative ABC transport system permease protein